MVYDTDNLHLSKEFLDFLAQANTDISVDMLGFLHNSDLIIYADILYGFVREMMKAKNSRLNNLSTMRSHIRSHRNTLECAKTAGFAVM